MIPDADTPDYRLLVPVLTLRDTAGRIDRAANIAYAQKAAETWLNGFIISGTIGGGDVSTPTQRQELLELWLDHVASERVYGCAWQPQDYEPIVQAGARLTIVMRNLADEAQALAFLTALPPGSHIYSHPRYTPTTYTASVAAHAVQRGIQAAGGKICKVSLAEVRSLRETAGPAFGLYDGSCRHIAESIAAGATGTIAVPLCTLPALPARSYLHAVQKMINQGQAQLDADTSTMIRTTRLEAAARALL